jgi:N-methylhydantoinase A
MSAMRQVRVGVDIGGTFTDLVLLDDEGRVHLSKISSTPERPEVAVLTGINDSLSDARLSPADVVEVLHGTTVGSNTLLQKSGAKCGLITTKGFRDVLEIGRIRTPTMFDLTWDKPEPLIARRYRQEINERISSTGEILQALDVQEILKVGAFFEAEGVDSLAVCFINSYINPTHELRAEQALRSAFPDIWVTASVSVLPEIREYERTSTAAVNAYVLPVLRSYFRRLELGLREIGVKAPLLISNSNGGLSAAAVAQAKPVFFISSGRSAGVVGAQRLGQAITERNLIVFDMGGTTASAALIRDGQVSRTNEYEFRGGISIPSRFIKAGGYLMRVPAVDVAEVGSGAGSIARIDDGGLLHVGPVSAGAVPGPACYGTGGDRATVTDANVVLGILPPVLAAGSLRLDVDLARAAIARDLAHPLGLSIEEAAYGVRELANVNMARAIRAVTVERGVDPRDFALLAFGGSGPVHACDLARTLGISRVIFPRAPGVFTAMGMLAGNVERYFLRAFPTLLHDIRADAVNRLIDELRHEALIAMADEGYDQKRIELHFELDMRFRGQDSELAITVPETVTQEHPELLRQEFLEAYKAIYGYASADDVEVANIRVRAVGVNPRRLDFGALKLSQFDPRISQQPKRKIYVDRVAEWQDVKVMNRSQFSGMEIGPLVLESSESTIFIPRNARARLDGAGNVVVVLDDASGNG